MVRAKVAQHGLEPMGLSPAHIGSRMRFAVDIVAEALPRTSPSGSTLAVMRLEELGRCIRVQEAAC